MTATPQVTLESILADLDNMGVGDDVAIDGGDAVDYLNRLREDLLAAGVGR